MPACLLGLMYDDVAATTTMRKQICLAALQANGTPRRIILIALARGRTICRVCFSVFVRVCVLFIESLSVCVCAFRETLDGNSSDMRNFFFFRLLFPQLLVLLVLLVLLMRLENESINLVMI